MRSPVTQWLFVGAALLILGGILGAHIYSEYDTIAVHERERLTTLARVIDENFGHQLHATDRALDSIRNDLPFLKKQGDGAALLHRRLQAMSDAMPGVRTLLILDAEGTVIASDREELVGKNFREREYFQIGRKGRDPAMLHVTPPFRTVLGVFAMNVEKMIPDDRGEFAGLISATLDPEYFSTLLSSVLYAPDMRSSLVHGDGKIAFRVPDPQGIVGTDLAAMPGSFFTRHTTSGRPTNASTGIVGSTGEERLTILHTVALPAVSTDKPLVIALSREMPALFSAWRKEAYVQGGLFGALVLASIPGLYLYQRRQRIYGNLADEQEAERQRAQAIILQERDFTREALDSLPGLFYLIDHQGRFLRWNHNFETVSGYGADEISIMSPVDFFGEAHKGPIAEAIQRVHEHGEAQVEAEFLSKSRMHTPFLFTGKRYLLEQTPCVMGMGIDVSQRKQAEQALWESMTYNQILFAGSHIPLAVLDPETGRLVDCNQAAVDIYGLGNRDAVLTLRPEDLGTPLQYDGRGSAESAVEHIEAALRTGSHVFEWRHQRPDGHVWDAEVHLMAFHHNGKPLLQFSLQDISERKRAEANLRIAAIAFESEEGMFVTDVDQRILRINRAGCEISGYSAGDAIGQTPRLFKSDRHDAAFFREMWASIVENGSWKGELWNRRKNGEVYPEWISISAVKGDDGKVTHYVAGFTDISERKLAEEEIQHLAFFDSLTRLPNRRLLLDRLQHALATGSRSEHAGALLFIDVDNFKTLNDTLGHDKGDLLLVSIARRLTGAVREEDTVARLGGDEFVVMLEGLSLNSSDAAAQAKLVGEKILHVMDPQHDLAGLSYHSTVSIGITLFVHQADTLDELLKRADLAMYQAKAAGRNTLRFFDPDMQSVVMVRAELEADLRVGLEKNQLLLHYQPQVDGRGVVTGAEALVRWQHPGRGLISPVEFIPMAEETGLILPLGNWVLETACAQLRNWADREATARLTLSVNVSARQFRQADFVEQVLAVLQRSGADPRRLKLELTESLLLEDVEGVVVKMTALKERGIGFSLDDFGTGYSSLSYLKRLPLDQLKIDQSFVRDVLVDPNDAAIARTIVALGQSMGLTVIAEGVETAEQRDFLAANGCSYYQGYLFGRPVPATEFEHLPVWA